MDLELVFRASNALALFGWLLLLLSPWILQFAVLVTRYLIPLLLAIAYSALTLTNWTQLEGGFDSLDNVILLFSQPPAVVAGWLHYLAFDLFVGCWIVCRARTEQILFVLVIPCLLLTFMFGPIGYLLFTFIRVGKGSMSWSEIASAGRVN